MEKFLNGTIDGEEFSDSFLELRRKLIYTCDEFISELVSEKLKNFQPDVKSAGFGSLISFLRFEEDYDNKEFYDSIKNCFLKLQKILDEEYYNGQ